jgi:hypothetical protein
MSDQDWTNDPSLGGFGNPNLPAPPVADPEAGTVLAPPAPGSSTAPNWAFSGGGGSRPQLPRSPKSLAIALVLVLVLAAGSFLVLNRKGSNSGGTAFALSLVQGQTYRYQMGLAFNGNVSAGGQQIPFNMKAAETISWKIDSLDQDGVANVTMSIEQLSATVNGVRSPSDLPPPVKIRVARDGRVLTAGNIELAGQGDAGTLFPGSDQFIPLLPDHPVQPGDYWTKNFDQEFPFGAGHLHYITRNLYVRDEMVGDVNAAVISSSVKLPLDFSIDLSKLAKAIGQTGGQVPSGAKMIFGGSADVTTLAWLDVQRGELVKSSGNGRIDMTVELKGVPDLQNLGAAKIGIAGNLSIDVTNLPDSTPKPKPKPKKSGK